MKKLVLAFVLIMFVASVPASAMKIIHNDEKNRIVPSRSGLCYSDSDNLGNGAVTYQKPKYDSRFRYLSNDIRPELIGTTWYYYKNVHYVDDNAGKNIADNRSKVYRYGKRYIREAADYYYTDTLEHTDYNFSKEI